MKPKEMQKDAEKMTSGGAFPPGLKMRCRAKYYKENMASTQEFRFNEQVYFYPLNSREKKVAYQIFQRAYQRQVEGDLDEAAALYKDSIKVYPTAEAYTFLGWTYSFMGLYEEAIEACHEAIETDPDFGNPYNDIGAYLMELGDVDEAIPWLQKAVQAKRYETYHFPYFNLGRAWEKKGDWHRAIESYRNALKKNPHYEQADRAITRLSAWMN